MLPLNLIEQEIYIDTIQFKHLKFEKSKDEYIVTLIDKVGYEIVRGYGDTIVEAINDLHSLLL